MSYIFLFSQIEGKGLGEVSITPTLAFASSFARKWASVAPVMVSLILLFNLYSTSDFRIRSVAIISTL